MWPWQRSTKDIGWKTVGKRRAGRVGQLSWRAEENGSMFIIEVQYSVLGSLLGSRFDSTHDWHILTDSLLWSNFRFECLLWISLNQDWMVGIKTMVTKSKEFRLPSGKPTKNDGTSPFFYGTITFFYGNITIFYGKSHFFLWEDLSISMAIFKYFQ